MAYLTFLPDGNLRCAIKAIPGASRTAVQGARGDELVVKVAAAPEKGKANQELIAFLAKACGLPKSSVRLVSGDRAQHKVLEFPARAQEFLSGFLP